MRGGFIDDPDAFDPAFFGISPREAAAMDPQQRLLLQCSWRAIEDAAVAPEDLAGTDTGVFVGVMANEWAHLQLADYDGITARHGSGNGYFMGANRVSYHLDLKGPSLAVDTACSSSLVALHLASGALRAGDCDYALAGGTNLIMTPVLNIFYTQAGLSAPDGRCKPFSASADGIGRAEGVAVLVLRRLADALADRQPVYAVLRGTGVNQDGRSNGITAPNRWAQQQLIERVWRSADVGADDIGFIEAHGTGTLLGDMMEAQALGHLTSGRSGGSVALGSVKSNFGHAEGAAGIAGVVKTVLALHHRTVPPSRFADDENPGLQLPERRLTLLRSPLRLPSGTVHAAVSSFGMGGTNAHAVLSSPPRAVHRSGERVPGVFTVSARSARQLRPNLLAQADALARLPEDRLAQLCWTSNRVKSRLPHRVAVASGDLAGLVAGLREAAERTHDEEGGVRRTAPTVAFAFTGQGAQHPGMAASWYASSPSTPASSTRSTSTSPSTSAARCATRSWRAIPGWTALVSPSPRSSRSSTRWRAPWPTPGSGPPPSSATASASSPPPARPERSNPPTRPASWPAGVHSWRRSRTAAACSPYRCPRRRWRRCSPIPRGYASRPSTVRAAPWSPGSSTNSPCCAPRWPTGASPPGR